MRIQSHFEEQLNAWSHGIGALLGIAGLVLLVVFTQNTIEWSLFSVIVYGISIIVLRPRFHTANQDGSIPVRQFLPSIRCI